MTDYLHQGSQSFLAERTLTRSQHYMIFIANLKTTLLGRIRDLNGTHVDWAVVCPHLIQNR